jgi:glycosyltransferase involved in cell wall biosynthesis
MKIAILTQYYPPEHGAPQNRLHDLAKRWVGSGEEVTVLTAMPNYPKGEIFPEYRGKFMSQEEIDGVKVIRSAIFASKNKSTLIQLMVYFSFVFSSLLVGMFKLKRTDFLICESPPLFLGFSALLLKVMKRAKLVMNISDLWPESAVQLGIIGPGLPLSILEWFEKLLYRQSAMVSCQTEGIVQGVKDKYPASETLLFPNGVDLEMFSPGESDTELKKELEFPDDYFVVGYGGNHGRSQALSQILEAAKLLKDEKIFFVLFGDGPEKEALQQQAIELGLDNLKFYPSRDRKEMGKILPLWDVALVSLKNIELFNGARPSKMFELMAVEIPFIFCGCGEGADLALSSGCAQVVEPENSEALAAEIKRMSAMDKTEIEAMGKAGRKFVAENFDRSKLAIAFLEKLQQILK